MSFLNKKAKNQNDRISDLPCNVIDGIVANLDILDQVRTGILSKTWRYMWTSAPRLCFDAHFFIRHADHPYPVVVVSKIIMDVLMLHNGPIHEFTLFVPPHESFDEITIEFFNMWIPILSRKDIKYLNLINFNLVPDEIPYTVFSCKELTYFSFGGFHLAIPPDFCGFKKLLQLHLYMVYFKSGAFETLMSGSPFLEKLSIERCHGCYNLDISAPALKVFVLILDNNMTSISLDRAKNLIDVTLHIDANLMAVCGLIKSLPKIKRFFALRSFSHTKGKSPYAGNIPPQLLPSSFSSLENMELTNFNLNDKENILYFVRVLKSASSLVKLVFKDYQHYAGTTQVFEHFKELESHSCCLKLQTVNIYVGDMTPHAMSLIKFILANSPSLETLTFCWVGMKLDAPVLLNTAKYLLQMQRASPKAEVKLVG